jgi:non-ribosomal peptide synthetase component F
MLAFQNNVQVSLELPGLIATPEPVDTASAKFDLLLNLSKRREPDGSPAGINGVLEYATDLFDRASVEAMADRLVRLLEAALASPDIPISHIDILSAAHMTQPFSATQTTRGAIPLTLSTGLLATISTNYLPQLRL